MIRLFAVVFFALVLLSVVTPWLHKLRFSKLPGDLHFRIFGRDGAIPLGSRVLLVR